MELDKIVGELVESRFRKMLIECLDGVDNDEGTSLGYLQDAVRSKVYEILKAEVGKRSDEIQEMVNDRISAWVKKVRVGISINTNAYLP